MLRTEECYKYSCEPIYTLYIVHCISYIVHCTLYIVYCTLYILYCILYIVHCILYILYLRKKQTTYTDKGPKVRRIFRPVNGMDWVSVNRDMKFIIIGRTVSSTFNFTAGARTVSQLWPFDILGGKCLSGTWYYRTVMVIVMVMVICLYSKW